MSKVIDLLTFHAKDQKSASKLSQIQKYDKEQKKHPLKESILESLCEEINHWTESESELIEDTDGHYAEMIHECELQKTDLSDKAALLVSLLTDRYDGSDKIDGILRECSEIEFIRNYYCRENEISSYVLGEIELQIPDDLLEKYGIDSIEDLSKDDQEYVQRNTEYYVSGNFVYISYDYYRFGLILDEDMLYEHMEELKIDMSELDAEKINN